MYITKHWQRLTSTSIVFIMIACTTNHHGKPFPADAQASSELRIFENDLLNARERGAAVLAPTEFEQAQHHQKTARGLLKKKGWQRTALQHISDGKYRLQRSLELAEANQEKLKDVFLARRRAIEEGARDRFDSEFKAADVRFTEITHGMEKSPFKSYHQKRFELQSKYEDLEVRAIKQTKLQLSRDNISTSIREGAKLKAPAALAVALRSMRETEAYITSYPRDFERVRMMSSDTLASTEHLLNVTRGIAPVVTKKSHSADLQEKYTALRRVLAPQEAEVFRKGTNLIVRLKGLKFPSASAELSGANLQLMEKVRKVLGSFGGGVILVQGHTDSSGDAKLNQEISQSRAESVKDFFRDNGTALDMSIEAQGLGHKQPIASNRTAQGRASNRRVDLVITPDRQEEVLAR